MAKSSKSANGKGKDKSGASSKANFDKIAKAAMSREMLAAGLTAAAAAIAASPKARRAIHDAGMDAADSASAATTNMMSSVSKLGSLIAEAVADAAQRVLSGKWVDEAGDAASDAVTKVKRAIGATPERKPAAKRPPAKKAPAAKPAAKSGAAKSGPRKASTTAAKRRSSSAARKRPTKPATPAS